MRPSRSLGVPIVLFAILLASWAFAPLARAQGAPAVHAYDRTADNEWAVAGASARDGWRGAAYVYRHVGDSWSLAATLTPPGRTGFARFGGAVAIEGDLLVVGAPWDEDLKGAAYVYQRRAGLWTLAARLAPAGAVGDRFGTRVNITDGSVSLAADGGAVARFARGDAGWNEVSRTPGVAGVKSLAAPGRAVDPALMDEVEKQDAKPAPAATAIAPPTFLRASDNTYEDRTELRWAPVTGGPFLYTIYRRLASDPPSANVLVRVASQDDVLWNDTSGTPGVTYTYCIAVLDMTNTEGGTTCDDGGRIIFAPGNFAASDAVYEHAVRLQWADRSNIETGYRILRDGDPLVVTFPDVTAYDDTSAVPGTTYSYSIVAVDDAAHTSTSSSDNGSSAFIGAPLAVAASDGLYPDKVVISWVDQTRLEVHYRVYRNGALRSTLPPNTVSFDDDTATPGTPYEYCVAAVDGANRESGRTCDFGGIGTLPPAALVTASDNTFDDKVHVAWQDTTNVEDGWLLYRMPVSTTDSILVANLGADATSFDDASGEPGQIYTYCVVAFSNHGGRSAAMCDNGTRAVVLSPSVVSATDGTFEDRVDLAWESTSTSQVLFKIYRGGVFIRSVSGSARTYSDDGVASGAVTTYGVTAVTALGVESAPTTDNGYRTILAPVSVKATDVANEDRVIVTWADRSAIEDGYYVGRRVNGTADPFVRIAMRPADAASYDDPTGIPGVTYDYAVTAFQAFGAGNADTTESGPGVDPGSRALSPPTFVTASDGSYESQVVLSWVDNCRFEEAYHVWRRDTTTNVSSRVAVLPPNANGYTDATVAFGATYEYTVYAVDSLGVSLLGRSSAGRDEGNTALVPPLGVSASDLYDNRVSIAWIDQSNLETGYRITRDGTQIGTVPANVTSYDDVTATPGAQYTYCVQATAPAGSSVEVCDTGKTSGFVADTSPLTFLDLPGGDAVPAGFFPTNPGALGTSLDGDGDWLLLGDPKMEYLYDTGTVDFLGNPIFNSALGRGLVHISHRDGNSNALSGGFTFSSDLNIAGAGNSSDNLGGKWFGQSGALSGDNLIATYNATNLGQERFVFAHRSGSTWTPDAPVNLGAIGSGTVPFGKVDLDGTNAVVGRSDNILRFYSRSASWSQTASFSEPARSVAISGNTALIGESGSVKVFTTTSGNWSNDQGALTPPSPDPGFGYAVDISGDLAVVGAFNGSSTYGAYVFQRSAGTWQLMTSLSPAGTGANSQFGASVSIRGTTILIGAPDNTGGTGRVWLYTLVNGEWVRREVLRGPTSCSTCVTSAVSRGSTVRVLAGSLLAADLDGRRPDGAAKPRAYVEAVYYPPLSPIAAVSSVTASDAVYRDKVLIKWVDGTSNEAGFKVYRDGDLIATLDPNATTYTDVDAAPGRTHEYCVTAFVTNIPSGAVTNESSRTCDFGRRPPDGNITGRVSTLAGASVSGVSVCLDPSPNRSLLLDGSGGSMSVANTPLFGGAFTTEFWYRGQSNAAGAPVVYSTSGVPNAFSIRNPTNLAIAVNGTSVPTNVAINDGSWHHVAVAWTSASGALVVYKDGQQVYTGTLASGQTPATGGSLVFGASMPGAIDDIRVWNRARTQLEIQNARTEFLNGNEDGLAAYWPLNDSEGFGAEDLAGNRYGRITAGANWISEAPPMDACALADVQGNYVLPAIRYGTTTTFKVTPSMSSHQFEPAFKTITLSTGSPVQNEVAFTDITTYTVSGFVRYPGLSCAAANVPIYVDDEVRGTTDSNGRYAVSASPGAHRIEPRLAGHTFLPAAIQLENVASNLQDQSFDETTIRKLTGTVGGGCNVPIGTLTIRLESENGCVARTFDASTGFGEALPPLKFFARVTHVTGAPGGVDAGNVLQYFDDAGAREVDLTAADQTLDFRYRAPVRVEIEGLPDPPSACAITVPVIAQTDRYPLTIRVFEDYGTSTCPVDTGSVTVFDEILDQEKNPVTLVVKDGLAYVSTSSGLEKYVTIGNKPNIFAGRIDSEGNDRSYQKPLTVVANVEGQRPVSKTIWAIVTGHRPRAATFTALSEGIPLFILHDPPGDHSFSSLAKETSFCTKFSNLTIGKFSTGFDAKAILGLNIDLGLFVLTRVKAQLFVQGGIEIGVEANGSNEMEVCGRTTEEFRTSSDNLFIGRDGDLYVGMALNLLFAKTDVIKVEGCHVVASEDVTIGVDDVQSVYAFTDWHIRNVLIPQLEDLARLNPADSVRYNSARRNWEAHLALNDSIKAAATPDKNRSFSAGADYAFSSTVDTTRSSGWSVNVFTESQYAMGFDFEVAGSGAGFSWFNKFGISHERTGSGTSTASQTTSYTLSDDDIGDFFSVNVKKDAVYGTPVFDILGGTSSCPWEPWPDPISELPRTQPVDGPKLTVEPPVRNNVPPDQPAVFTLNLTNDSQNGSLREYQLYAVQESNPGGAVLRLDGDPFASNGVSYFIPAGETRQATLTVERGPTQYFYDNLKIVMVPPCEYELFRNGGPLNLSNAVSVSVAFDAPCSDIKLLRPNPGWSVQAGTDSLELILTDFELAISESDSLLTIGAEYQRAGTDVWTPIGSEIPLSHLTLGVDGKPASVSVKWPIASVPEGTYAVRAFTRCPNGRNYSAPATGVIDRSAPLVFGTPQPADGVLSFGEDISVTFNEDIDCASANSTTVRLETTGGTPQLLDSHVTCNGQTLVIAATAGLAAYEGQLLRATVTGIRDKVGNVATTATWTFTVRQGEFAWNRSDVSQDAGYGTGGRVAVSLVNGLNQKVRYTLGALPAWLTAEPVATDTIPAKSLAEVAFQISPTTALGSYDASIVATANTVPPTTPRTATLNVHVNVLRVPPTWAVHPSDYEHSMTVRAKVFVGPDSSVTSGDVLAAFVGDQVRGVAHPQLVSDGWRYFLTVYGKPPAFERIRFKVWDSRTSQTYTATDRTLRFVADSTYGGYGHPIEIRTRVPSPANEQVIAVNSGWTWFSVNRRPSTQDDRTVAAVLSNLIPSAGDLVKAQDGSVSMFDATAGWIGTLDTLGVTASYRMKAAAAGEIRYESARVLPSLYSIPVKKGWNWIGYTPDDARAPGVALSALASAAGDVLRSQSAFAEFATGAWAGSLAQMAPGQGFNLFRTSATATSFAYDDVVVGPMLAAAAKGGAPEPTALVPVDTNGLPVWECDYRSFQYDMVVTVQVSGMAPGALRQIAAVVDGEIRGVAKPVYVPALDRTLFFVMVRSNQPRGETVRFQALDHASGKVYAIGGSVAFEADAVMGTTSAPVALTSDGTILADIGLPVSFELGNSRPNPMVGNNAAIVRYAVPKQTHVQIELFDINGRRVREVVNANQAPGWYDVAISPHDLHGGVFFYRMRAGSYSATRRLVVVR